MNDKWLRIIGIPLIAFIALGYFKPDAYLSLDIRILTGLLVSFFHTFVIWEGNRFIHFKLRQRFPGYHNTTQRIFWEVILALFYTVIITTLLTLLTKSTEKYDPHFFSGGGLVVCIYESILFSLFCLAIFMTVYEARYFWDQLKLNIQETEALARSHVETQLDVLKKQLDPHFLFNSLNTLSALISTDNQPAQYYLEQLSDVYRYVLSTRDKTTVSLEEEIKFLEAYLFLNKTRFRENLQVENEIPAEAYSQHIPVLSLQMLVENAIKHNVISRDRPLRIRIFREDDKVTVENNKQLKSTLGKSTRVGLQNIINRYKLLTTAPIDVINTDEYFKVRLPLL